MNINETREETITDETFGKLLKKIDGLKNSNVSPKTRELLTKTVSQFQSFTHLHDRLNVNSDFLADELAKESWNSAKAVLSEIGPFNKGALAAVALAGLFKVLQMEISLRKQK